MLNKVVSLLLFGGASAISHIEQLLDLEAPGRALNGVEIAELERVFAGAIDYQRVVIKAGNSHLLTIAARAFVLGDTIYFPDADYSLDLLVHEMTHIWQHQHGGLQYISKALWAQQFGEGYDFARAIRAGREWQQMNPEQQAELIQQGYLSRWFHLPNTRFIFNEEDYTDYLASAVQQLRAGQGAP